MQTFAYLCFVAIFVLAISLGIAACATIINGSQESVIIKANPPGAQIAVDGKKIGPDSVKCKMERGSVHYVDVTMDGFRPAHIRTGIGVNPWYWTNVALFFEYSWIDLITDAAYSVEPNPIIIALSPGSGEPTVKVYDTSGRWIAPLPLEVIGAALVVFFVWFTVGTIQMYNR
jgi:PEGA domain